MPESVRSLDAETRKLLRLAVSNTRREQARYDDAEAASAHLDAAIRRRAERQPATPEPPSLPSKKKAVPPPKPNGRAHVRGRVLGAVSPPAPPPRPRRRCIVDQRTANETRATMESDVAELDARLAALRAHQDLLERSDDLLARVMALVPEESTVDSYAQAMLVVAAAFHRRLRVASPMPEPSVTAQAAAATPKEPPANDSRPKATP